MSSLPSARTLSSSPSSAVHSIQTKQRQGVWAIGRGSLAIWASTLTVLFIGAGLRLIQISQYPPGFHYDEAVNFIVSREIAFFDARPFPVFAAFNGREVFYYYVNAIAMRGIGEHIFTMHFVSAMMNLLTIATTIALGRAMFGRRRGVILGLLAAGFLSVSFPQIFIARQAFRAVSLPILQALCLWTLFAGLRQSQSKRWLPWLIAAGIFGGATFYTYMASRLFPAWVAAILGTVWLFDRSNRKIRLIQVILVILALLITAAPIINYYLDNQDVFADRLTQLSASDETISYTESIRLHARMFFIDGDPYIRYNEPFAPYFTPFVGILLVLGLGVSLWRIFDPKTSSPLSRTAYLLIAASPLMIIPSVLAVNGLPPSHMRSIGMVPAIFFLPAIGGEFLWTQIRAYLTSNPSFSHYIQPIGSLITSAIFIALAVLVWNRYRNWASNPELFYLADGDMVAAGDWLEDHIDDDTLMYVTSLHYDHPSLQIHDLPADNITYLLGERLFIPPANREAYFIETHNAPLPQSLQPFTVPFERINGTPGPDGQPSFIAYHWQPTDPEIVSTGDETFGGILVFSEADLPSATAGQTVTITTQWHILTPPQYDDLTPIFVLETPEDDTLSRTEPYSLHTLRWRAGETLIQQSTFDIPIGTPPGQYPIKVTWVGRTADQYIGLVDDLGAFSGLWLTIGDLDIQSPSTFPSPDTLSIPNPTTIDLADGIRLLGWNHFTQTVRPGEGLNLDLYWQAIPTDQFRPTTPIQLLAISPETDSMLLWDAMPVMNRYSFDQWTDNELVVDRHRWTLPTDMPSGNYQLILQLAETEVELGDFEVLAIDRQFESPTVENPLDLNLSELVSLVGYDLSIDTLSLGEPLTLTLYWQSLATTDLPLTVFVHLEGPDGINHAQRDWQPRQNTYPVALWIPGEYIDDTYTLTLPADAPLGTYTLKVGMYLQETGQRLSITTGGESVGDFWPIAEMTVGE